jgi:hypothetical protein
MVRFEQSVILIFFGVMGGTGLMSDHRAACSSSGQISGFAGIKHLSLPHLLHFVLKDGFQLLKNNQFIQIICLILFPNSNNYPSLLQIKY